MLRPFESAISCSRCSRARATITARAGQAWAVGFYAGEKTNHFQHRTLVEHVDGTKFVRASSPMPGLRAALRAVGGRSRNGLWATGLFSEPGFDMYDGGYILPTTLTLRHS